jgi:Mg2+/Co2+ transporter CorB
MSPGEWARMGIAMGVAGIAALLAGLGTARFRGRTRNRPVAVAQKDASEGPVPDAGQSEAAARGRRKILELEDLEVSDVMVHRTNMQSINADDPPEAIVHAVIQSPYTRLPLWRGSLNNIIGILHSRDLLRALADVGFDYGRIDAVKVAAKPWFVPDTTSLNDQLNAFLRRKSHFAIVVDEYGEVEGLVTLEDIIEEIVGDIADEHDINVQGVRQEADGSVVVDGSVPIRDLNRALGWSLPDEEATTVAGLIIHESQSIPEEKQAFTFFGKRFIVLKREKNRIARIRIRAAGEMAPVDPRNNDAAAGATSASSRPEPLPRSPTHERRRATRRPAAH